MNSRFKQLLTVLFALVLAGVLVACGAEEDDGDAVLDLEDATATQDAPLVEEDVEEATPTEEVAPTEEPMAEEETPEAETAEGEEEPQAQPPLGDQEVFGEGEIDYLEADEQLLQSEAMTQTMITSDEFIGLDLVTADDVHLGEVVEVYFDIDGNIPYIVFDIEEEAVVEVETILGRDLFDEEVDTVLVSTNLLNISAAESEDVADVDVQTPYRLTLLQNFGEDIPFIAQEIDAALVESDQLFLDPARFGFGDAVGERELLQMSNFETFDLTDHDIVTPDGEDIGDVDDLIVDMSEGRVAYATVDVGGFLDMDQPNEVAIPWSEISFQTQDDNFVVETDAATLEGAPTVDDNELEDGVLGDSLVNDIDAYWDQEA